MNLKCAVGMHDWKGCKCPKCGKTRDKDHDWRADCEKCGTCGKARTNAHPWSGCKCPKCGKTRDEGHEWTGLTCQSCGKLDAHRASQELMVAAQEGDATAVANLLSLGADPNCVNPDGMTPLMVAVVSGSIDLVGLLLERGAATNVKEKKAGFTPLMLAVMGKHVKIVEMLVSKGVDANQCDSFGKVPIVAAAEDIQEEIVKLLVPKSNRRSRTAALMEAASRDSTPILTLILDSGIEVDAFWQGRTAWACAIGTDTKRFLREKGATCGRTAIEALRRQLVEKKARSLYSERSVEEAVEEYGSAIVEVLRTRNNRTRLY